MVRPGVFALIYLFVVSGSFAYAGSFRAGAAAIDITPPDEMLPVAVNGGFTAKFVSTITDRLHAKAIALADGKTTIVLCTVDSCLIDRALLDEAKAIAAKETGLPTSVMLVSSTHTHSAPSAVGAHGTDADERYRAFLPGKIAEAIVAAHAEARTRGCRLRRRRMYRVGSLPTLADEAGNCADGSVHGPRRELRSDEPRQPKPEHDPADGAF